MPAQHPAHQRRVDRDGVTEIRQPRTGKGPWILGLVTVLAFGLLTLAGWLFLVPSVEDAPPPPAMRELRPSAKSEPPAAVVARPAARSPSRPAAPPPTAPPQPPPEPERSESAPPPPSDVPSGGKSGLALFRPGIKPIRKGIVVPENFPLPPGYVRHYQTMDDGRELPAILMFHPDYQPRDANGQPVPLPENRIVPPELVPPGLPVQMLEVPQGEGGSEAPP
jgi:hypothetical protein